MEKRFSQFLGTLASVLMALILWALVLAISNSNIHPLDITRNQRFTLSPQSKLAVTNLEQPVKAYAFVTTQEKPKAEELLKRYRNVDKSRFDFQVLDPRKNPVLAKKFQIRLPGEGVIEVQSAEKGAGRVERLSTVSEDTVTSALLKLQRKKTFHAYFLSGHGEREIDKGEGDSLTMLKADLISEGFQCDNLSLLSSPKIPADADLIVAAGPVRALLPGEEKLLRDYLSNYGRFLLACEPETPESFTNLVKDYGMEVTDKVVLDLNSSLLNAEPVYAIGLSFDPNHPITKDFRTNTMFVLARALQATTPPPSGVITTNLVSTSGKEKTALLVSVKEVLDRAGIKIDPSKVAPTQALLAMAATKKEPEAATPSPTPAEGQEKPKETKETRVVCMGDADALTNALYNVNKDLALNSFSWLAANETQISIRPKDPQATPMTISGGDQLRMLIVVSLIIPGALVGLGAFLVIRRQ